ncbi:hypothetical protein B0T18DRAFT_428298 [Schizothecium vesticola]|uniref:Uncharacterized protein n=1 Tax=Schizothecium vesticola TaxID=314040 RepID=A0AA40F3L1_9PEZI|nr:hypothetical protein B0T18DRAFT_428298 [Schizothecium vesticola]
MSKDINQNDKTTTMAEKTTDIFTAREQEIMLNALLCMKEAPTVDFNDLAARLGMSNVRSASNAWAALRKKIQERNPNPDGGPVLVPAKRTPAAAGTGTGNKRKKGIPTTPVTPTAAVKKEAAAAATTPADAAADDDSIEELSAQPAAKRAKRVVPGLANPQGEVGEMVLPDAETTTPVPKAKGGKPRAPAKPRVKKEKVVAASAAGEEGEEAAAVLKKAPAKATPRKKAPKVVKSDAVVKEEEEEGSEEADMAATAAAAIEVAEEAAFAGGEEDSAMDEDSEGVEVIGGKV